MSKDYGNRFLHWRGWKKIFPFPAWADGAMLGAFCAGIIWVFIKGLELWWPAYLLYGLSAYSLTAFCIKLPGAIRREKDWVQRHPKTEKLLKDQALHFQLGLYLEQFINFAFYKFISAFVELARDRKHTHPIDSSVRMLSLSQAIFAIFSLQAGLLHTFGTGESWEQLLNLAVGCTVCLLTVAMGIYMIRRANRELKNIQENQYGQ